MSITAATLARALEDAATEAGTLARFLDDLDGWDGSDCDTGTNAARTLAAMSRAAKGEHPDASFVDALDAAVLAGISQGHGHIGVILTALFASWERALEAEPSPTPVALRRMLRAGIDGPRHSIAPSLAIRSVLDSAAAAVDGLGDTLPGDAYLVSWYSLAAQEGLVAATNERTGLIDPGASVLTIVFACLDAAVAEDQSVLHSLARMLSELAESGGAAPRPHTPAPGRAFAVDALWQGTEDDASAWLDALRTIGARTSCAGVVDPFGVGTWRLHIDTSAPLAVRPRSGRLVRFAVVDSRPDEEIGVDELDSSVITHRGVLLLERRTLRRVERARVLACTRAPGLIEDLARTGAVVLLDPLPEDGAGLASIARATSTGVTLFAPCDEPSAELGRRLEAALSDPAEDGPVRVLVADSRDDLAAYSLALACAGLFVPRPGGREAAETMSRILLDEARHALELEAAVPLPEDPAAIVPLVSELAARSQGAWRLLVRASDGPELVALVRQLVAHEDLGHSEVEVIDGGHTGPTLIQRSGR